MFIDQRLCRRSRSSAYRTWCPSRFALPGAAGAAAGWRGAAGTSAVRRGRVWRRSRRGFERRDGDVAAVAAPRPLCPGGSSAPRPCVVAVESQDRLSRRNATRMPSTWKEWTRRARDTVAEARRETGRRPPRAALKHIARHGTAIGHNELASGDMSFALHRAAQRKGEKIGATGRSPDRPPSHPAGKQLGWLRVSLGRRKGGPRVLVSPPFAPPATDEGVHGCACSGRRAARRGPERL